MKFETTRIRAQTGMVWGTHAALGLALATCGACMDVSGDPRDAEPGAPPIAGGTILAEFEIEAPSRPDFVLHGTIPVPPGTYPRADGKLPLAIRGPNGFIVPTSVRTVSNYASASQGADVIEVAGRVGLPSGTQAGKKLIYKVVYEPHEPGAVSLPGVVKTLLDTPQSVVLRARDVFGHVYSAEYVDAWKDVFKDTSWTTAQLDNLRAVVSNSED